MCDYPLGRCIFARELSLSGSRSGYTVPTWLNRAISGYRAHTVLVAATVFRFVSRASSGSVSVSKETLRKEAVRCRDRIVPDPARSERLCRRFFDAIQPDLSQIVAAYWPKGREASPLAILERLAEQNYACALPVIPEEGRVLRFARWHATEPLKEGPYGILQPPINQETLWVDPDIVVVPLLAFDRLGNRLGYGGGYYDATLSALRARKNILVVGLAYAEQLCLFPLPSEPHDQRLDCVLTPESCLRF